MSVSPAPPIVNGGGGEQFCLRWNNYQSNITSVFESLLRNETFVDVTLACDGAQVKAHKVVLSACSPYFQAVLSANPCKHPVIIMPKEVGFLDLKYIVEFMYRGMIDVAHEHLPTLLKAAEALQIKGLCEVHENGPSHISVDRHEEGANGATSSDEDAHRARLTKYKRRFPPRLSRKGLGCSSDEMGSNEETSPSSNAKVPRLSPSRNESLFPFSSHHPSSTSPPNITLSPTDLSLAHPPHLPPPSAHQPLGTPSPIPSGRHLVFTHPPPPPPHMGPGGIPHPQHPAPIDYSQVLTNMNGDMTTQELMSAYSSAIQHHHQQLRPRSPSSLHPPLLPQHPGALHHHGGHSMPNSRPCTPSPGHPHGAFSAVRQRSATPLNSHRFNLDHGPRLGSDGATPTNSTVADSRSPSHKESGGSGDEKEMEPPSLNLVSDGRRNEDGSGEDEDNAGNEPRSVLVDGSPNGGTLIKQESVISHHSEDSYDSQMTVTPELSGMVQSPRDGGTPKPKGEGDEAFQRYLSTLNLEEKMELALESLRNKTLSLYKASATYGVASTSLWVRARRAGIDSMKKEGSKSYSEDNLNLALEALRQGKISANRASKEFGIPGSTLYKMAKKEGIKLASPFNLTPPNWSEEDLRKAFDAVKNGMSVLKAASEHGIPSGTLYGKCRREGIELRGKESSQWNQGVLAEALEAVRVGEMSINQASVRYNLPYSTLYNRFRKVALQEENEELNPKLEPA